MRIQAEGGKKMAVYYLCGHGAWDTIGAATGFVSLPPGTTVHFYSDTGQVLYLGQACDILAHRPNAPQSVQDFSQYQSVRDMKLYPCPEFQADFQQAAQTGGSTIVMANEEVTLSEALQTYGGNDLHWIACSVRGLNAT
jgi:hypothetical protein